MREIRDWLRSEETHRNSSMAVVNIIAHGTKEGFVRAAWDGHGWFLPDVIGTLSDVKELSGKPKLFFVNACRGCKYLWQVA